jgi:4-amino-4-deoxy-L-arabinose transferase-like glycosyltransferase
MKDAAEISETHEGAWRRVATAALLALGAACWIWLAKAGTGGAGPLVAMGIAAAIAAVVVWWVPRGVWGKGAFAAIVSPSVQGRAVVAGGLSLLAMFYFFATAVSQGRGFGPVLHDEHCYIIQARMLAHGRLWMPRHELGDFFDSFHMITDRVYASKYGPGTALFGVPAVWAGLEPWVTPLVLTSLSVGLCYLVLLEMLDGLAALLGALMLPSLSVVRRISIEVLAQAPMLFLLLLAVWAFLMWRRRKSTGWLALMSVAIGWGAITRPSDPLCLAVPLLIGVPMELWGAPWRRRGVQLGVAVAAVTPFLVLQLVCDKGITGRWLTLPWSYYGQRNDVYDTLSSAPIDASRRSQSVVPENVKFQDDFAIPAYREKLATPLPRRLVEKVRLTLEADLANPLLVILVPVGLVVVLRRGRWVLVAALALFLLFYAQYTFFLDHYAVVVAPAVALLVLLGWRVTARAVPPAVARRSVTGLLGAAVVGLVAAGYPQLRTDPPTDEWAFAPILRLIDGRLAELGRKPAIVLFRFDVENGNPHIEPVYNTDVAWPDHAAVIRAHDLGKERNRQLFEYYARQTEDRAVYLFDLSAAKLQSPPEYLGTVRELAKRGP